MQMLTQQEKERFEPLAKVLAANGVAQSLSFSTERKYLDGISASSKPFHLTLATKHEDLPTAPYWIKSPKWGNRMITALKSVSPLSRKF